MARKNASSIEIDIIRFQTADIERETDAGKLDIGLILRDIRQTLVKTTRNFGKKTLGLNPGEC